MPGMDPQLAQLLQQHAGNFSEEPNGKVLCKLNGHAFPARYDVLKSFIEYVGCVARAMLVRQPFNSGAFSLQWQQVQEAGHARCC